MEMFLDEIPDRRHGEHDVDERRNQRQQNLEDHNVRQRHPSEYTLTGEDSAMLVHGLQNAERPAKTLAHQAIRVDRRFGVGERHVFVFDAVTEAEQRHGQVGVFGDGVGVEASSRAHGRHAPSADRAGHHADRAQHIECAAFEILAGDVFERLPARPQIHAVTHFCVACDRPDLRVDEMRDQPRDGVGGDDGIGVDTDKQFSIADVLDAVVESLGFARVSFAKDKHAAIG